jgi:hypothetical protein
VSYRAHRLAGRRSRRSFGNAASPTLPESYVFEHRGHTIDVQQVCAAPDMWCAVIRDRRGDFVWQTFGETMVRAQQAAEKLLDKQLGPRSTKAA